MRRGQNATVNYYRRLAKQCGVWAVARHLAKKGYTLEQVKSMLVFDKRAQA